MCAGNWLGVDRRRERMLTCRLRYVSVGRRGVGGWLGGKRGVEVLLLVSPRRVSSFVRRVSRMLALSSAIEDKEEVEEGG